MQKFVDARLHFCCKNNSSFEYELLELQDSSFSSSGWIAYPSSFTRANKSVHPEQFSEFHSKIFQDEMRIDSLINPSERNISLLATVPHVEQVNKMDDKVTLTVRGNLHNVCIRYTLIGGKKSRLNHRSGRYKPDP